ncbi:DUF1772-domain-containing protein [Cutaneotrichosporon oleaginosum]|uniref:DUF1772-domain-containing protein n=1 Tax=Cutaneotrichosporon oleaginosum TaxID=879819 RepID=A0A0J0XTA3_9TREE|nr:DUF1772-domain-containing protein [Cutaneotrichosporon oleaginosum]KLT44323.1 DUF1772-domain-containing protein [Cutaneotrichosporon oleaginosum]TXT07949.1 hypothetical protein COLE_04873 [Cutaneotrichosporon oleaginosum]
MPNTTLAAIGLFGSATASSYVLFSNLGMSQYGLVPFIRGKVADVRLSAADKLRTWVGYYNGGKFWSITGAVVNALCGTLVALTHPAIEIQRLGLGSAVLGLAIVPYTLLGIKPTNDKIFALEAKARRGENVDDKKVDGLVEEWVSLHNVRYVAYVSSWLLSAAALAMNGNVLIEVLDVVYRAPPVYYSSGPV